MIVAYFESLRYVGHLLPIIVLRLYMGYFFLSQAIEKIESDYILQPKLAALISENLMSSQPPEWFARFLDEIVVPHWQVFAYTQVYFEFLVGLSFLLGFFVRPVAFLGALLAWSLLYIESPSQQMFHQLQIVVFLTLGLIGAGRCLGIDYFFYKRQRGWLW